MDRYECQLIDDVLWACELDLSYQAKGKRKSGVYVLRSQDGRWLVDSSDDFAANKRLGLPAIGFVVPGDSDTGINLSGAVATYNKTNYPSLWELAELLEACRLVNRFGQLSKVPAGNICH